MWKSYRFLWFIEMEYFMHHYLVTKKKIIFVMSIVFNLVQFGTGD